MASYVQAVGWIAGNDGAGDTPDGMNPIDAYNVLDGQVTVCMVADLWNKNQAQVAIDVARARGFIFPKWFVSAKLKECS